MNFILQTAQNRRNICSKARRNFRLFPYSARLRLLLISDAYVLRLFTNPYDQKFRLLPTVSSISMNNLLVGWYKLRKWSNKNVCLLLQISRRIYIFSSPFFWFRFRFKNNIFKNVWLILFKNVLVMTVTLKMTLYSVVHQNRLLLILIIFSLQLAWFREELFTFINIHEETIKIIIR